MLIKVMPGRVAVKKHEAKLKGAIQLPVNRARLYEIGEVVATGDLARYGPEGKSSTAELYPEGSLVLFQLPISFANLASFNIKGVLHCFLHVEDIIAHLASDVISYEAIRIAGNYLLLEPMLRSSSSIILPDTAEEAKREVLHYTLLQKGADVALDLFLGQEVFPDRSKATPIGVDQRDLVFVHQNFIYGALEV